MYPPHPYPVPYPHGYDYAYGAEEWPEDGGHFVGAPPAASGGGTTFSTVALVGIVVAGALGAYLIYEASKHAAPMQKRLTRAAVKAINTEAKRQGRVVGKNAGEAATNIARGFIEQRLAQRKPKRVKVEVLRTISSP